MAATSQRKARYDAYIKSAAWQEKRGPALERAEHRCQVCNSAKHLDVHHRTYERFECEHPGDLTVLCRRCHDLFHDSRSRKSKKSRKPKSRPKKPLKPCTQCGRKTSKGTCKPCRGKSPYSHSRKRYASEVRPPVVKHIADVGLNEPPMKRIKT